MNMHTWIYLTQRHCFLQVHSNDKVPLYLDGTYGRVSHDTGHDTHIINAIYGKHNTFIKILWSKVSIVEGKCDKKAKFLYVAVGHGGARHILTRSKSDQLSKVILCFIFVQLFSNVYFQIWAVTQAIDFFQPSKEFSSCFVFFYFKLWWT